MELEQSSRRHLIEDFHDVKQRVGLLERRLNIAYGAWAVLGAGFAANAAKIWFGL